MQTFWKNFWWCMASLGGAVGLYVGCADFGYAWAFWLTLGGALLIALAWSLGPRVFNWAEWVRDYPTVLRRAGELQNENDDLRRARSELELEATSQYQAGVDEGRSQISGALKAARVRTIPKIVSVEVAGGDAYLVGEVDRPILIGSRYVVETVVAGVVKGTVEVTEFDLSRMLVTLICVSVESEKFWSQVADRAAADPSPPPGVRLGRVRELEIDTEADPDESAGITEAH